MNHVLEPGGACDGAVLFDEFGKIWAFGVEIGDRNRVVNIMVDNLDVGLGGVAKTAAGKSIKMWRGILQESAIAEPVID